MSWLTVGCTLTVQHKNQTWLSLPLSYSFENINNRSLTWFCVCCKAPMWEYILTHETCLFSHLLPLSSKVPHLLAHTHTLSNTQPCCILYFPFLKMMHEKQSRWDLKTLGMHINDLALCSPGIQIKGLYFKRCKYQKRLSWGPKKGDYNRAKNSMANLECVKWVSWSFYINLKLIILSSAEKRESIRGPDITLGPLGACQWAKAPVMTQHFTLWDYDLSSK